MSQEVEHSYWHYWKPGQRLKIGPEDMREFQRYMHKANHAGSYHRLIMLALAYDANPIADIYGESRIALATTDLETLAACVQRSQRTVQRLLRELEDWAELEIRPCDKHCHKWHKRRGSNHYYLALPVDDDQPWMRKTKGDKARGRKRSNSSKKDA